MAFFDELGKAFSDAGQSVAKQTKNISEITQLTAAIADKEKNINKLCLELGQKYYEKNKDNPNCEEFELIQYISNLQSEIFANRERIKQIRGIQKCPHCGSEIPLTASFCQSCGNKVEREEPKAQECPNCHNVVEPGSGFCPYCGTRMR